MIGADENGAVRVGAYFGYVRLPGLVLGDDILDRELARNVGQEILNNFAPEVEVNEEANSFQHSLRVVVMLPEDYEALKRRAYGRD